MYSLLSGEARGCHGQQFSIMNRIMFKVHHEANIDAPFMIKKQRNRSNRVCNGKLARVPACPRILFEICTKKSHLLMNCA